MVVTNLRIPRTDYLQIKSIAADKGMSVNEYVNQIVKDNSREKMMKKDATKQKKKKVSVYEAFARIAKIPNKPMGWSEEDEAIYSV